MAEARKSLLVYRVPREGKPPFVFDFNELDLAFEVARGLRRALEAQMGHTGIENQGKAFMALRKMSRCLEERNLRTCSPLPRNLLPIFAEWLKHSSLGPSAHTSLVKVRTLLEWCERNIPGIMENGFEFAIPRIRHLQNSNARTGIEEAVLRQILRACYLEIEEIESHRAKVRRILSGKTDSSEEKAYLTVVRDLTWVGSGQLARQPDYHRAGGALSRRVESLGGSRRIAQETYLSPRDLIPFLVAIVAQVSGNPRSVLDMQADCVVSHPIRDDLERLVWLKKRSSREQFVDFPKGKDWSAPSLARRLNNLTAPLRPKAADHCRSKLFICYLWLSRKVGMPDVAKLNDELRKFRDRHSLPAFQLRDLRRTGAQIIRSVRGSDRDAQRYLNHELADTTRRYIATQAVADEEERVIQTHQIQIAQLALEGSPSAAAPGANLEDLGPPPSGMETVFGFRCKDPFSGIAPGSVRGSMCLSFFGCATCAGALIPLDDIEVVARLVAAADALDAARTRAQIEGWWRRYESVYEPTRVLIRRDLLPSVSEPILSRAKTMANSQSIPRLE